MKLKLSGFPSGIPIAQKTLENWSLAIKGPRLWTCTPRTAEEVVAVCEWARRNSYTVRPRGLMHGFSPLTVTSETTAATKVLLVDTTVHLHSMTMIPRSGNHPPWREFSRALRLMRLSTSWNSSLESMEFRL